MINYTPPVKERKPADYALLLLLPVYFFHATLTYLLVYLSRTLHFIANRLDDVAFYFGTD